MINNAYTLLTIIAIAVSLAMSGCRPKVDYSPPRTKKTPTAASSKAYESSRSNSWRDREDDEDSPQETTTDQTAVAVVQQPWGSGPDLIAYDEFDGVNRGGWKQPGLGEWAKAGEERDGALVVSGDVNLFRELAAPVGDGVVWYAVTMHMETQVAGYAHVAPSENAKTNFLKLGFSAVETPYTSRGFFVQSELETRIENTDRQTFLTRNNFALSRMEGFAARGDGFSLIGDNGVVIKRPRMRGDEGTFEVGSIRHLGIFKKGPEKLIIDRVALSRRPATAIFPQMPVEAPKPGDNPPPKGDQAADLQAGSKAGG
jgi:hypothetical protein